jgi:uncharacterized protein
MSEFATIVKKKEDITIHDLTDIIREEFSKKNIPIDQLYLFGSRAKGNARPDSDYDFLVVTAIQIERLIQRRIISEIRRRLVFDFDIDADILVIPKDLIPSSLKDKGRISYYAIREGIAV